MGGDGRVGAGCDVDVVKGIALGLAPGGEEAEAGLAHCAAGQRERALPGRPVVRRGVDSCTRALQGEGRAAARGAAGAVSGGDGGQQRSEREVAGLETCS